MSKDKDKDKNKDKKLKDKKEKKGKKSKKELKSSKKKRKKSLVIGIPLLEASSRSESPDIVFEVPSSEMDTKDGSRSRNTVETEIELEAEFVTISDIEPTIEIESHQGSATHPQARSTLVDETIDRPQLAADLFQSSYNGPGTDGETIRLSCAQAILLPYCKEVGLSEKQCLELGKGFAMGMMNDSTCGALVAAIMLAGLSGATLEATSTIFQEFKERYGSTQCKDILEGPITCRDIIKHACTLYEKHSMSVTL